MLAGVSDLLARIRKELDDRVAALRPAAEELARLQQAVDALDGLRPADASRRPASPARPPPRAARAKPSGRRRASRAGTERAAPGQTQLRVIEQLRSNPGSSSTAVAHALGISANAAAATISRLVKQDRVSRVRTGGYAAAEGRPSETASTDAPPPAPDPDAS